MLCKIFYDFGQKSVQNIWNWWEECAIFAPAFRKGGAPAGRDGEEGGSEEAGVGQESGRGSGRGISLSFSSSGKSLKKYAERFGGERKKPLSLHPLSPEKID